MRVAVVGGGVIGLAAAWSLARRGAEVTVVERERCGAGASAGNAGWVTPGLSAPIPAPGVMRQAARWMLDADSPLLVRPRASLDFLRWSARFARSCRAGAHRAGTAATLALARETTSLFDLLAEEGVEFEMHEDGLLYLVRDERHLDEWLAAYALLEELGFDGEITPLDRAGVAAVEPAAGEAVVAGLLAGRERHVRPETLTAGLMADLRRRGVAIEEGVEVRGLGPTGDGGWLVYASGGALDADRVVVAAGVWSSELLRGCGVRVPLEAAKGYSVTARGPDPLPRRPLYLTEAKVGASPYADGTLRIAGTLELAGIDLDLNGRRVDAVARNARDYLRDWRPEGARRDWCGLRPLAPDGLPVVGEARPGLFVATGHAMLGVTLAPATGEALAGPVLGEEELAPALAPLGPARFDRAAPTNGEVERWGHDRRDSRVVVGR
ncbi:MAG TPA: FAD-dependent oxidoreductase [Solirubrobacteraceae bacterium]